MDADGRAARERARPGLAWVGEPDWAPHIAPLPFADEFASFRARCSSREEFAATMPAEWVDQLALAGTADEVRTKIVARHAAGATSVVLIPAAPETLDELARVL
ncbi:hypothetical protein [Actinoplanes sp. NBRC 103695]|uniref:hypothetical protein n=1 Tax=Actinoplanes sp. NBRC 103695 TaxID=3032202 RepID=UPI0024A4F80D|nr:hypothetical protein [Actinoplanes sp. NBRC 103695]GLY98953.1 hypothetical protein Acsp02_62070 [Actinoplanes sp. NBRC 103695]